MSTEKVYVTVVFRVWANGDVMALMPYEVDHNCMCTSYQHVGQHSSAEYYHCIKITEPATPEEFAPLKRELESLGYVVKVNKRANGPKIEEAYRQARGL